MDNEIHKKKKLLFLQILSEIEVLIIHLNSTRGELIAAEDSLKTVNTTLTSRL